MHELSWVFLGMCSSASGWIHTAACFSPVTWLLTILWTAPSPVFTPTPVATGFLCTVVSPMWSLSLLLHSSAAPLLQDNYQNVQITVLPSCWPRLELSTLKPWPRVSSPEVQELPACSHALFSHLISGLLLPVWWVFSRPSYLKLQACVPSSLVSKLYPPLLLCFYS